MKRNSSYRAGFSYDQLENRQLLAADVGFDVIETTTSEPEIRGCSGAAHDQEVTPETLDSSTAVDEAVANDVVLAWNNLFGDLLVENTENQNPGYASRSMAILNLAIYDSATLAAGDSSDAFYDYSSDAIDESSPISAEVTASQAAYTVLSALYPNQQATIDNYLDSTLDGVLDDVDQGESAATSIEVGTEIANTILAARADDGFDAIGEYTYTDGVGSFQADPLNPDVPVWGPTWGDVETFAISSAESFTPDTTPELTSEEYAESYNEVKELGSVDSTTRTAEQTEVGIFWAYDRGGLGTPFALFSDVLETIAIQEDNTLEENAALFAQASVAMADAGVVAWETKFSEEFWRPGTAINQGDSDGNDSTESDVDWIALGAPDGSDDVIGFTPQFPTYISGHATFGAALFGSLQEFYGKDDISFELTSTELDVLLKNPELQGAYGLELDDATRTFSSFSEAMAENGRSRVYLGIHFDFDDTVGQEVGQAIAAEVASNFVVPDDHKDLVNNRDQFARESQTRDRIQKSRRGAQSLEIDNAFADFHSGGNRRKR